jgi:P27 family predicted phage terminase small subunit
MKKLSPQAQKLRKAILSSYEIEDEAALAVLRTTLEAYDLMHDAQTRIDAEGLTVQGDRGGIKQHPLLQVVRDQRAQFLMGIKALRLDIGEEEKAPIGRPTAYQTWQKRGTI